MPLGQAKLPAMRKTVFLLSLSCCTALARAGGLADPWPLDALVAQPAACSTALPDVPLTLAAAVDLALCRQPQTREVWAAARVQAAQLRLAESAWLPRLDGKAVASRTVGETQAVNQQTAALTLSWLVFDSGQRAANTENARAVLDAALASRDATVQALVLATIQAYHGAQASQAAVEAARSAEKAAQTTFDAAQARYQVGAGTPADRLQAQTAWSQARLNRQRAEGEVKNSSGALAYALGFPAQTPILFAPRLPLADLATLTREVDGLIAQAVAQRPDLRAAEAQVRAAQASVSAAQAAGRPTLAFSAGPSWQQVSGINSQASVLGLTLNIPLFTGYDTTYRVQQAHAQETLRAAQRDRLQNQVALDVWRAYQNWQTASHSLAMTADLLASAEQSAAVALGRYQAGVGTVLESLSAQSALAAARLQRIQAELDGQLARATLAQAMGELDGLPRSTAAEREK